jgi:hypothetical protein
MRCQAIGDQVETGTVFMNRCDYLDPALVWTGVKDTGKGAGLSEIGYDNLTRPKSYHLAGGFVMCVIPSWFEALVRDPFRTFAGYFEIFRNGSRIAALRFASNGFRDDAGAITGAKHPMSKLVSKWNYPTTVRFGAGRISELPDALNATGIKRPLFVTDPGLAKLPVVAEDAEVAGRCRRQIRRVHRRAPNPVESNLTAGIEVFKKGQA